MYRRIETKEGLCQSVIELGSRLGGVNSCDLWKPIIGPGRQNYSRFWFTEKGWELVGSYFPGLFDKHGIEYQILESEQVSIVYEDEYQVATYIGEYIMLIRKTTKPNDLLPLIGKQVVVSCRCPDGYHTDRYFGTLSQIDKGGFTITGDIHFGDCFFELGKTAEDCEVTIEELIN